MSHYQRAQLTVDDSGNRSAREFLYDPTCCGWELSFRTTQTVGQWIFLNVRVRDEFEGGPAQQVIGPFMATTGGKLYIPFPTFSIEGLDVAAGAAGNTSTVDIVARTVTAAAPCNTSSLAVGGRAVDVAAATTVNVNVPASAIAYKVTTSGTATSYDIRLTFGVPAVAILSEYSIEAALTSAPDTGGQRWRETTAHPGTINVSNTDAVNPGVAFVWFLFDFARVT
jgi:hypothetical protein